jgi:hypothetical protein
LYKIPTTKLFVHGMFITQSYNGWNTLFGSGTRKITHFKTISSNEATNMTLQDSMKNDTERFSLNHGIHLSK